jgi:hypothetical protein
MIYNIKQNHTGNTDNQLIGHARADNGYTYRVHSCKISNVDTTDIYVTIKLHSSTTTVEILKTFLIKKGYSVELFDTPFEYPDEYDLLLALDNSAYAVSWITKSEVLNIEYHTEC